jgi:peptidoglycan/LPS O-acetylase OafA/YrhL
LIAAVTIIVLLGLADISSFMNSDNGNDFPNSYYFQAAGSVLTFWHNVLMQKVGYFNYALNIYWSLSVEEVFYLGFPLTCIMLSRQRLVLIACMILIIVGPLYRAQHTDNDLYYMYGYFACFDAIAFGVATALLSSSVSRKGLHVLFIQAFAALLLVLTFWQGIHGHEILGFSQIALGTSLLLMFQPSKFTYDGLVSRGLRSMGRCSYEIYLFHIILLGLLREAIPRLEMDDSVKLLWLCAYILASALLGELISRYYSEPINKILRINFGRRKSETLVEDSPAN